MQNDIYNSLNPAQKKAVITHKGALLIIAGAGSGKTRVITYRIASMLEAGISQEAILAVTFTNKAAAEMRHRIRELTQKKSTGLALLTFHAFGLKILRENHQLLNYRRDFSVFDETDKESLIRELMHELNYDQGSFSPATISSYFSLVKNGRAGWEKSFRSLAPLYDEYNHALALYNAFDFDDLIVVPLRLFQQYPEVLSQYQDRYRYIMVDEFQDTSDLQYQFITTLARKYGNICVVGDDDQSIYSFRGAHFANLLRFEKDFPNLVEIKLEENYRCSQIILQAANQVIAHNTQRKPKVLFTSAQGGEPITVLFPQNEREEASLIAELIRENLAQRHLPYHEIGILVRTNHLTRSLEEALLACRLPYRISGGVSFFSRKEVKDILAYLTVIVNPSDEINLLRIINTPRRGIGKNILAELIKLARARQISLFEILQALATDNLPDFPYPKVRDAVVEFLDCLTAFKQKMSEQNGLTRGLRELVARIDYWNYLLNTYKKEQLARYKYANIDSLINSISEYEEDEDIEKKSLRDYLYRINLLSLEDREDDEESDKVNLMTVHAAKGLEFSVVFLAACEEGIFPHERTVQEHSENLEEERRLFYVALTRCKSKLYISAAKTRRRLGVALESSPSQFLEEIPQELCEVYQPETLNPQKISSMLSELKARYK